MREGSGEKIRLHNKGRGSNVMKVDFVDGSHQEIVIDSGAEENVCPYEWGLELYGLEEADRWIQFRGASGSIIDHYGQRVVQAKSFF